MNCPKCGEATSVTHCRKDCESVYRRRKCKVCGHIFYTNEYEVESGDQYRETDSQYRSERRKKKIAELKASEPVQLQMEIP